LEISTDRKRTDPSSPSPKPWWHRFSNPIQPENILDEDLPPDQFYATDIFHRSNQITLPQRIAPTIRYDILNVLTAYCLNLRRSNFKNFWSIIDEDDDSNEKLIEASNRILQTSGCLSNMEIFSSSSLAMENIFYQSMIDEELRRNIKSDLIIILTNIDWRKNGRKSGQKRFVFSALGDLLFLFTRTMRKIVENGEEKKNFRRICQKLEFYLKFIESNENIWPILADDLKSS